jgi:hypothetical protein
MDLHFARSWMEYTGKGGSIEINSDIRFFHRK